MKPYGDIKLPIKSPVKVPLTSNMDALDFMLDLLFDNMYHKIKLMYNDTRLTLNIIKARTRINSYPYFYDVFVLIICNPPLYWRTFNDQKYVIITSKLLYDMIHYFMTLKSKVKNKHEFELVNDIISSIEMHLINYRKYGIL